jgi:succinoglycan biosynthesis transport protein ExoP
MSILQFLGIIWARRYTILGVTIFCALVGVLVANLVPPKYEAQSRVMLDIIKPDPVTGQVMATAFIRAYTKTQIQLLQDYKVASEVVDNLKWSKNPKFIKEYKNRAAGDDRDFTRWAAQRIVDGTKADLLENSNILEITYRSESPQEAKAVADGLLKAYVDTTLETRRDTAKRNASWYEAQAEKAKVELFKAEDEKSSFEKESGIILQDNKVDLDSARLTALAGAAAAPMIAPPSSSGPSPGSLQLEQMDEQIGQLSKTLGPNHPTLIELHRRREMLAKQVAAESSNSGAANSATMSVARATQALLEQQKTRVLGQRDKVEKLRLLADDVELRRGEYNKSVGRAAELRQEADVSETGVTPLGNADTPTAPAFPNKPLVMAGGLFLGLALGLFSSLILELFGRRIRGYQDLRSAIPVPVLAIVARPRTRTGLHLRARLMRMLKRSRGGRTQPVQA